MDPVTATIATQVQALLLGDARAPLERAQAAPLPADAPPAAHAAVILELSAAAQRLTVQP
jgi:hypothetical protein